MLKFGPWIILRVDEEPFYGHFRRFWATMPADMKDAARLSAIHLKYRPGMKPKAPQPTIGIACAESTTVTMNIEGATLT